MLVIAAVLLAVSVVAAGRVLCGAGFYIRGTPSRPALCSRAVIGVIITLIGVVSGLIALYEFGAKQRKKKVLTWKEVDELLVELIEDVERDRFTPDLVLGVGRGGSLIAAMYATNVVGRIPFDCVDTEVFDDDHGQKQVTIRHGQTLPDVKGLNVLVIVAELYSGKDLAVGIDFVKEREPKEIKTMALLAGPTTIVKPNFCGRKTEHEPLAPWRITEAGKGGRI
jgi:hypoxanthine phosphoribosyltransferase